MFVFRPKHNFGSFNLAWNKFKMQKIEDCYYFKKAKALASEIEPLQAIVNELKMKKATAGIWNAVKQCELEIAEQKLEKLEAEKSEYIQIAKKAVAKGIGSETNFAAAAPRNKRPKTDCKSPVAGLNYDPSSTLFELNSAHLADSGLPVSQPLVLYCRPLFHQQFKFLQESVIDNSRFGWILGPPGTGKSMTALAFASTLDTKKWRVTWIHLSRMTFPVCVQYERGVKKTCKLNIFRIWDELAAVLGDVNNSAQHIVFIDGYVSDGTQHQDIVMEANAWRKKLNVNRRLVILCSMSSRRETNLDEDIMNNVDEFFVPSWELDEYLEAVKHDSFFNNVRHNLDSSDNYRISPEEPTDAEPSRIELIKSKFYFAGGCARFMFHFNTATVIEFLDESTAAVSDVIPYLKGEIYMESSGVISRLFSIVRQSYCLTADSEVDHRIVYIVSDWAASQLSMRFGPDFVKNVARHHKYLAMTNGWSFERWFFALLRNCGVILCDDNGERLGQWAPSIVETFSDPPASRNALPDDYGVWLKPSTRNHGGFDAVFINRCGGLVRFVQLVRDDSPSFQIGYFRKFIDVLQASPLNIEINTLEIVFLVLKGKVANFKISEVSGEGLLAPFGWEKGEESSQVQVFGISGWS